MLLSGILTRRQRRVTRRPPESNRKRKLGGNAGDHRPYFTYWITFVQVLVLFISTLTYGVGPIGIDLYKKAGMVSHQVQLHNQQQLCILCWDRLHFNQKTGKRSLAKCFLLGTTSQSLATDA